MTRHSRAPFDPSKPFVARRSFTFNGRRFATGDPFPWRRLSCSVRKLRDLHGGNFVAIDEKKPKQKAKAAKVKKSKTTVVAETQVGKTSSDNEIESFLNGETD